MKGGRMDEGGEQIIGVVPWQKGKDGMGGKDKMFEMESERKKQQLESEQEQRNVRKKDKRSGNRTKLFGGACCASTPCRSCCQSKPTDPTRLFRSVDNKFNICITRYVCFQKQTKASALYC